MLFKLTLNFV